MSVARRLTKVIIACGAVKIVLLSKAFVFLASGGFALGTSILFGGTPQVELGHSEEGARKDVCGGLTQRFDQLPRLLIWQWALPPQPLFSILRIFFQDSLPG